MIITRFIIEGLFGKTNVDLPISNNKLVIVGVNGTGKSTVINIFYYFISRRWNKLAEMPFQSLSLELNGEHLYLNRDEIKGALRYRGEFNRLIRHYVPSSALPIDDAFFDWFASSKLANDPAFEISLARNLSIPPSQLKRFLTIFNERTQDERLRLEPSENFSSVSKIVQQ